MSDSILYGKVFSNVVISDDEGNTIPIRKTYNIENSIYYSIKNTGLQVASENFESSMSKLLNIASKSFIKNNIPKWRLKFPGGQPTIMDLETKQPISYDKYKEKITEGLISEEEGIVLLSEAFDLINLNEKNAKNLDDFDKTVIKIGNTVAQNWNIPLDIFYGSKTEKSTGTNDFITLAVEPHFKNLEDGFNIGFVGKKDYLQGEYIAFNKFNIIHRDIIESANGIDKLTADGFSRNEINKLLGLPRIDEPWADEHNLTKNYANVKGGANEDGK